MHLAKPLSWPQTSEAHRVLKACTRHALGQIVYDDSDEVDYTNRVPRLRPVSNEIRRSSPLVGTFRRSGGRTGTTRVPLRGGRLRRSKRTTAREAWRCRAVCTRRASRRVTSPHLAAPRLASPRLARHLHRVAALLTWIYLRHLYNARPPSRRSHLSLLREAGEQKRVLWRLARFDVLG